MATSLLLHCDDTDGSTDIVDEAGNTVTANGTAQISTAQSKFGVSSVYFSGSTSSFLAITPTTNVDLKDQPAFTVDKWFYNTAGSGTNRTFISAWPIASNSHVAWRILITASNVISAEFNSTASIAGTTTITLNAWHHVAYTFDGTTHRLFLDGVLEVSTTAGMITISSAHAVYIGKNYSEWPFAGYIDEPRIVKGEALYTANFTPPSAPFTPPTISGNVKNDAGANASRTVRVYRRDTGDLLKEVTSDGTTGDYSAALLGLSVLSPEECYVVCLDDASGTQYNALILDKMVSG